MEQDLAGKKLHTDDLVKYGNELLHNMSYAADDIKEFVTKLTENWKMIYELTAQRKKRLDEVLKLHQVSISSLGPHLVGLSVILIWVRGSVIFNE